MTAHDRYAELAGPWVLGLLDAAERREFEAHLESCAACQAEVRDAEAVAEALAEAVPQHAPPPDLRARVLAAAGPAPATNRTEAGAATGASGGRAWLAPWLLAAAASLAAVSLGLYAWTLRGRVNELSAALRATRSALAEATSRSAALEHAATQGSQLAGILSAPDAVRVDLVGQPSAPGASGHAFWSPTRGVVVAADRLPALPAGRVYQLWVVTASAKMSAGVWRPDPAGRMQAVAGVRADRAVAIAITIEPDGGVPSPTGPIYLLGSI